jgi:hypothetical protein
MVQTQITEKYRDVRGMFALPPDSVEKRFYGLERATLIQNWSRVRNFDSNRSLFGFDCCVLAAR